jgi:hypothetical protein
MRKERKMRLRFVEGTITADEAEIRGPVEP